MALPYISIDHIPDTDFRGVGRVAVAWSYLEGTLERIAWVCSNIKERHGICLTTHIGVKNRYDAALALLREELPESKPEKSLAAMNNQINNELYGLRNEIVHSRVFYFEDASTSYRRIYKARKKVKSETVPIDPTEYERVSTQIISTANQIMDILNETIALLTTKRGEPPPWPDRP